MESTSPAIERLYRVFSLHPASLKCFCLCCVTPEESKALLAKRLRELTGDDLSRYMHKAVTTWGTAEDFKHFFPRLLELALTEQEDFGLSELSRKLAVCEWPTWTKEERATVLTVLQDEWITLLNCDLDRAKWEAFFFLLHMAPFEANNLHWLNQWSAQSGYSPRSHLAQLAYRYVAEFRKHGLDGDSDWREYPDHWLQIREWLIQTETQRYLDEALLMPEADDYLAGASSTLIFWRDEQRRNVGI